MPKHTLVEYIEARHPEMDQERRDEALADSRD